MSVINRVQNRKSLAVVAIYVCAELMFHLVTFKICALAQFDQSVFCHCSSPHQIASCRVILRILNSSTEIADYASHKRLGNVVRYIVLVWLAEINLHNVRKNIKAAGHHLFFQHAVRIGRIEQGKFGVAFRIISARLDFQILVGNNCSTVALAARACHGDNYAEGQRLEVKDTPSRPKIRPYIAVIAGCNRNRLTAIHNRAAADS